MELCKSFDIHVVNGRVHADSFISRQTGKNSSVIDYVIMSPELFPSIHYYEVLEFDPLFSDIHCPVAFTMNMKSQENVILPNEENLVTDDSNEHSTFPTWKPESRLDFINYIQDSNLDQISIDLDILNQSDFVNADSINSITLQISQTLVGAAENCNMIKNKNNSSAKPQNRLKNQNPWFIKQSDLQSKEYLTVKRKHKQLNSGENYENLVSCSRKNKKLINKQMREYNSILTKKLKSMKNSDPKSYCSILNKYSSEGRDKLQKVSVESFYEHFSKLNEDTPEKRH